VFFFLCLKNGKNFLVFSSIAGWSSDFSFLILDWDLFWVLFGCSELIEVENLLSEKILFGECE